MVNRWHDPADEASPLRSQERQRVRDELEGRLTRSGIALTGTESDEQIVALADSLEAFESARARRGGDSMVNTPESSRPDDARLVIPVRRDDESVEQYLGRLREATRRL
jgi:hypothetical protein